MRHILFILIFIASLSAAAQVVGDITGDEIIDANDYILLKESIFKGKDFIAEADFDKDGEQSIRDLVLLYDFLYANGSHLTTLDFEEPKEAVEVSFGRFDIKKNSLEIIIRSKDLKGFQFELSKLKNIELLKSNQNFHVINNKIIGYKSKGFFADEVVIVLKLNSGIQDEYCIENEFFIDAVGNNFKGAIGDCANRSWSEAGLSRVKKVIDSNGFDSFTDIDRNGTVDIKDYAVLFDYLKLNGPTPPGKHLNAKNRVKLEFVQTEEKQDYFELVLSSNNEITGFDLSFYGLSKLITVSHPKITNIEHTDNRMIWLGNGGKGQKEIRLNVAFEELSKSKKICMRAPVFLDRNHQYFSVKLGKCFEIQDEKPLEIVKEKKEKPAKPEKVKKEKEVEEKAVKEIKERIPKKKKKSKSKNDEDQSLEDAGTIRKKVEDENSNSDDSLDIEQSNYDNPFDEENSDSKSTLSNFKKVNEISIREKKKNIEANNPKEPETVKILSLTNLQIKTIEGQKGQMIFNNEENVFMIFNGLKWEVLKAVPGITIEK